MAAPLTPVAITDLTQLTTPARDDKVLIYDASAGVTKYSDVEDVFSFGSVIAANGDTLAVTEDLHAGRIIQFGKTTGTVCTLPAATGTGNKYTFVIGITATSNHNIIKVANATDVMDGSICIQATTDVDGDVKVWRADTGDDTMKFAGAAGTGGIKGNRIECIDYAAGFWSCVAYTQSSGTEATPFDATVS